MVKYRIMCNYFLFRVYSFFLKKDKEYFRVNMILFLIVCQYSLFFGICLLASLIIDLQFIPQFLAEHIESKTLIVVVVTLISTSLNYTFLIKKENEGFFDKLSKKYKNSKYNIPMWIIFVLPIMIILGSILIYGSIAGTLRFPLFESIIKSYSD